jgi:ribokinase
VPGNLIVLGNACVDVTYHLSALPRPGETVNAEYVTRDLGGKGLNQAIAARRAGAELRFIAPVGRDPAASAIRRALAVEDIPNDDLIVRNGMCDSSVIMLDRAGENAIVSDTRQAGALTPAEVMPHLTLGQGDTLLLQGNLSAASTAAAVARATDMGAHVVINAAPFNPWLQDMRGAIGAIVVNAFEAMQWTGATTARAAANAIDAPVVVVTLGRGGCLVRGNDGTSTQFDAPSMRVVDTTGAGDVFVGTFVAEWLATSDPRGAARLAVHVASDMVTRVGTLLALPARDTVARLRAALDLAR